MSFRCAKCGPVGTGIRSFRVTTKIRGIEYILNIKRIYLNDTDYKIIGKRKGSEIVKEALYCREHIPTDIIPEIVETIQKDQIVKTLIINKNKKED